MNPRKIEDHRSDGCWYQLKTKIGVSNNGNYTFMHQGKRYVFKNYLEGTEVLVLQGNKWAKAGRIDRYGTIVLGNGESYSEMIERQNKGKTQMQIMAEIKSFLHPQECPALDKAERTLNSLKNVQETGL